MSLPGQTVQLSPFLAPQSVILSAANPQTMLDTRVFRNTFKTPALLDEIRFSCGRFQVNPFMYLEARIKFGDTELMRDWVPVSMLGTVFNRHKRIQALSADTSGNLLYSYEQVWRFAKPLFMDPDEQISIQFRLSTSLFPLLLTAFSPVATFPMPLTVALVARPLPLDQPPPKVLCIPWITVADSTAMLGTQASGAFPLGQKTVVRSTPTQLQNPHEQDLRIANIIGRIFTQYDDAIEGRFQLNANGTPNNQNGVATTANPQLYEQDITVQMKHINGFQVIKDPAPWGQVFSTTDNAWWTNAILKPKAFYIATLTADLRSYDATALPIAIPSFVSPIQAYIALHGYRQLRLR